MKHTPGPWCLIGLHCWEYQIGAPGQGEYVGQTTALAVVRNWDCQPPGEQIYANACLIAAAPELLEACRAAVTAIETSSFDRYAGAALTPACEALRAAIAKAEGRE